MTTITHFDQLQFAERWGLSPKTLERWRVSAPDQSTSGCLARLSTVCATSRPTKTSASFHRLPSSASRKYYLSKVFDPTADHMI